MRGWNLLVNSLLASPAVNRDIRRKVMRRIGLDIAPDAKILSGCFFGSEKIHIAPRTHIAPNVFFDGCDHIYVREGASVGFESVIITGTHEVGTPDMRIGKLVTAPVTIGEGCWIGAAVRILPGVTIGPGCVIGTGSVVISDTEPNCVYAGNPARLIRKIED